MQSPWGNCLPSLKTSTAEISFEWIFNIQFCRTAVNVTTTLRHTNLAVKASAASHAAKLVEQWSKKRVASSMQVWVGGPDAL